MEKNALHSQHRRQPAQRRALWVASLLVVFLVVTATGIAMYMLNAARERLVATLDHDLTPPIQTRIATLRVWYGKSQDQLTRLTNMDMLRLFATEVDDLGALVNDLIALESMEETSPGDSETLPRLASQMPLMRSLFTTLISQTSFISATLVTPGILPYLRSDGQKTDTVQPIAPLSPALREALQNCIDTGNTVMLPVVPLKDQLLLTLVQPIFAPSYVAGSSKRVVGAVAIDADVTDLVRSMTVVHSGKVTAQGSMILQLTDRGLQQIDPACGDMPLVDWQLDAQGELPVMPRTLPGGQLAYVLGKPVPNLPWLVVQDMPQDAVEAVFATQRSHLIFAVSASTLIALLLVGMFWWRLIERRERMIAGEFKHLYDTINQQHALLTGINGALADGLVMKDSQGVIQYVNDAFIALVGRPAEELRGQHIATMFEQKFAERVLRRMQRVMQQDKPELSQEFISIQGVRRHYQVACSPYHDENGQVYGVVSVYRDDTDLVLAQEHAQTMLHQTINVLVRAIEAIDPYLSGQSMYTGLLAAQLAHALKLGTEHVNTVRSAANLSQIGMIQLPRAIVNKTSTLTPGERTEMHKHVEYARRSLAGIDFGLPVVEAIYQMHERYDGSGYPKGLAGDAIRLDARILAVANTFCALVRPRSYRQAHSMEAALTILNAPQYDQAIVSVLRDFLQTANGKAFTESLLEIKGDR